MTRGERLFVEFRVAPQNSIIISTKNKEYKSVYFGLTMKITLEIVVMANGMGTFTAYQIFQ